MDTNNTSPPGGTRRPPGGGDTPPDVMVRGHPDLAQRVSQKKHWPLPLCGDAPPGVVARRRVSPRRGHSRRQSDHNVGLSLLRLICQTNHILSSDKASRFVRQITPTAAHPPAALESRSGEPKLVILYLQ